MPDGEPDGAAESDIIPQESVEKYYNDDIVGTYAGRSVATEAEYFRVKSNLNFNKVVIGEVKEITITIILDEMTAQYYIDGDPAEITELPNGDVYMESIAEYEGSMSLTTVSSLTFSQEQKEITGTMTDITFVYGATAAREIWSITVYLVGDNE